MNFNFGKMLGKLLSRKRYEVLDHAQKQVIEKPVITETINTNGKNGHIAGGGKSLVSRARRQMARRSRTLNSMRRRGKVYA